MSFIDELNSLDTSNPGGWPAWVKLGSIVLLMVVICAGGYFLQIKSQMEDLAKHQATERSEKDVYKIKQQRAAQLPAYKAQLAEMEVILQSMLRQLPSKNEMSDLIVDVSQTALASGIDNELFEPGAEILKDFYAEKPISLRMVGKYHQFGSFVSGVASLPRVVILTMHDISLKPLANGESGLLLLEGTARTYRYLDSEEQAAMDAVKATVKGAKR
ncbi:MAG TPA: type 4a pilus biogenesis protein PilO [Gammaproteobacteria bacterium]|jgi:type IV pilus assembly protein PilO|nr:type 4a pilus biogenesis protein PilO [Gammaproteobacteria bacterium]HPI96320.1 type 4a pilus biogenesis protein PilO [Gammaproteobacteria bacterium]HPQ87666.1 type 4a pilus biogenesis protein PilO [Gammaproteobacteria bacterium]